MPFIAVLSLLEWIFVVYLCADSVIYFNAPVVWNAIKKSMSFNNGIRLYLVLNLVYILHADDGQRQKHRNLLFSCKQDYPYQENDDLGTLICYITTASDPVDCWFFISSTISMFVFYWIRLRYHKQEQNTTSRMYLYETQIYRLSLERSKYLENPRNNQYSI